MTRFLFVLALSLAIGFQADDMPTDGYSWIHLCALAGITSALTLLFTWTISKMVFIWISHRLRATNIRLRDK